jgi:Flp pilus assembly protein TadD
MFKLGRLDEAVNYYESGRSLKPDHAGLSWMLGRTLLRQRKLDAAEQALRHALRFAPDQVEARTDLAEVLMLRGRAPEALDELTRVVQAQPRALEPRQQLAATLAAAGRTADAVQQYRELLRLTPDAPLVLNNLAWILATHPDASLRDGAEAVRLAERACQLVGNREAFLLGTLAAAYAEAGRFDEAVRTSTQAITLADQNGQSAVATSNRGLLDLYKAAKPYRDVATNAPPR